MTIVSLSDLPYKKMESRSAEEQRGKIFKAMEAAPPAAAAAASEGETSGPCWSASANWIVAEGSLDGSIVFDTTVDDAPPAAPGGAHLVRPLSLDSIPCEITISFKAKHDIHRVYIRSTARIYEIYYASDQQNHCKEYLCTVRCGAAAKEGTASSVTEGATTEPQQCNNVTKEIPEQIVEGDSNSSDEDGWVEVKVPDSLKQDDQAIFPSMKDVETITTNFKIHYEATAEISDATPCVSITLRLLSLETKTCVHIEEIYIYADPVESTIPDSSGSMGGSLGGSSLLAMFVPSLLQLSKSGASRIHNRCISDESELQNNQPVEKATETSSPCTGSTMLQEAYSTIADQKLGIYQEPAKPQQENTNSRSSEKLTDSNPVQESVTDENNLAFRRVEKVLDELVSRVGRIETFCSRFEENMMKPLGCIEMRLQHLEQQLDSFVVRSQSLERFPFSRIAAPEFSLDESDTENKDCNTKFTVRDDTAFHGSSPVADDMTASVPESQMCPGVMVKAPELLNEDNTCCGDTLDSVVMDCPNENKLASMDSSFTSLPESHMRPGLAVKAPEFVNEDDDYTNSDDTIDSVVKNRSSDNTVSVDGALAAALEAFLTSTSIRSPNSSLIDIPLEAYGGTDGYADFSNMKAHSEGVESMLNKSDLENNGCNIIDSSKKKTDFFEPLPLADDAVGPANLFGESDMDNRGCGASDVRREGNAISDSSIMADNSTSSVFASLTRSGLFVIAPELPIENGVFIVSDDASDSHAREPHKVQTGRPLGGGALAMFLSSMVKSSSGGATLLDSPLELSNSAKNELASSVGTSLQGVEKSGWLNSGNNINDKIDLNLSLDSGPPEDSLEQNEHYKMGNKCTSEDTPFEGSTPNCRPLEDSSEHKNNGMKWHEHFSNLKASEEGLLGKGLLHCLGVEVNGSINHSCHDGGSADDSDSEEAVSGRLSSNQIGSGYPVSSTESSLCEIPIRNKIQIDWSDASSTESSLSEIPIRNKIQTDCSDASSTDSYWGPFAENQCIGQAADYSSTTQVSVKSTDPSAGYCHKKSIAEIEHALHSIYYQAQVVDENVASECKWRNGVPLDVLLDEMSIGTASGDDDGGFATGQQRNPSPSQSVDEKGTTVDQLRTWVEDLIVLNEPSFMEDGAQEVPGSTNRQQFSSLI